ncbi:MAG: hypothetical protein ACLFSQ_00320 [Candidatus Zixiibacteriota bacterium]
MKRSILKISLALIIVSAFFFTGCDTCVNCNDRYDDCCDEDYYPPPVPYDVYTTTYDGFIEIDWHPIYSSDFDYYRVWRGYYESGEYTLIGETSTAFFTDYNVRNGQTYYYAISSVDYWGNESEMSYEIIYDTPRPEGHRYTIYSGDLYPESSGFDFSERYVVPWDDVNCDVFFSYDSDIEEFYLQAGNDMTDIMDYGYTSDLQDVDFAPETGWDPEGWEIAQRGHSYIIWTSDNHFAHLRITSMYDDRIIFDWAYQTDTGNPELFHRTEKELPVRDMITERTIERNNNYSENITMEEK